MYASTVYEQRIRNESEIIWDYYTQPCFNVENTDLPTTQFPRSSREPQMYFLFFLYVNL